MDNSRLNGVEGTWQGLDMAKKGNLRMASAKTPMENALYTFKAAQYHCMANPWMQGATRIGERY